MKTNNQLIELSLCLVCALAPVSLLTLKATPTDPPPAESVRLAEPESIQGKVSAKTDTSLTVDGKAIKRIPFRAGLRPVLKQPIQCDRVGAFRGACITGVKDQLR